MTADQITRLMLSREDPGYLIPTKIKDQDLRREVERHYHAVWKLWQMIWDPNFDEQKMAALMTSLGQSEGIIVDRMDQLGWPETSR